MVETTREPAKQGLRDLYDILTQLQYCYFILQLFLYNYIINVPLRNLLLGMKNNCSNTNSL